ncbi:MAG: hypothetical protein NT062_33560 [Proteobacteria bacterium]|nr:hypothetical protein [Pseudomonadota bacterium]
MSSHRSTIASISVVALVAMFAEARADVVCKATETQAECHARLQCKADEELEDCIKRLQQSAGARDDGARRGDRDANERDRDGERGRGRDGERERGGDRDGREEGSHRQRGSWQRDSGGHRRRAQGGGGKGFQANKTFGLGLELGEPTGLTGKYFVSDTGALDFGVGWIYSHYYYGDGIHLYGDFLWHPTSLVSADAFELPFYVGIGLRYWDFNYCDRNICTYGGSAVGLRVPIGIAFDFNRVPLDIFAQLVPVIDFVNGDYYARYNDRAHFGVDLSVGLRYWFK